FNFGGTLDLPFGKVKMVYALHTSSTPDGEYAGVPCGFVFFVGDKKIYFAGDTALTLEIKMIEGIALDCAVLLTGGHYTIDLFDAVEAAQVINCKHIIGVHYHTFPPSAIDTEKAISVCAASGLELQLPAIGATLTL